MMPNNVIFIAYSPLAQGNLINGKKHVGLGEKFNKKGQEGGREPKAQQDRPFSAMKQKEEAAFSAMKRKHEMQQASSFSAALQQTQHEPLV